MKKKLPGKVINLLPVIPVSAVTQSTKPSTSTSYHSDSDYDSSIFQEDNENDLDYFLKPLDNIVFCEFRA